MKRLIVDMDDVLADTSSKILSIFNTINKQEILPSYFLENDFYGFVRQEKFSAYRHTLLEPGFFSDLVVLPDAIDVMEDLNKKYDIYIVSAALEFPESLKEKYDWMKVHFPFIPWQKIVFCGDKSIVHGDIMIDDHARNFKNFNGEKLLFNAIHNIFVEGDFKRVHAWKEIHKLLG